MDSRTGVRGVHGAERELAYDVYSDHCATRSVHVLRVQAMDSIVEGVQPLPLSRKAEGEALRALGLMQLPADTKFSLIH